MADSSSQITKKLLELTRNTGYPIVQYNGQRKFGPPADWTGPPPPRGCEIFIGKLPRDIYEDELVPVLAKVGKIYEMRLMMDFSGSNRGFAFVTYGTRSEASAAVKQLNGYEIRPRRHLGVAKSVDNCRLFLGNLPRSKSKEEIFDELSKRVSDIVDVILYKNCFDRTQNRGFAFVEFTSHRAAALARRVLVPGFIKLWDRELTVDWAEPEPDIDDDQMDKIKVLYVRNFEIRTTPEVIQTLFEKAINSKIEKVKKICDYAFIHFYKRDHAELAFTKMQNANVDGSIIEIRWAKPVDREIYRIQKKNRGNAKFNKNMNFTQTLLLYKQHLEKREYANGSRNEGNGFMKAGDSKCCSPSPLNQSYPWSWVQANYTSAPAKLETMCNKYLWPLPIYKCFKHVDPTGRELWVYTVDLPQTRSPFSTVQHTLGPFTSRACCSSQQAYFEAAEMALNSLKMMTAEQPQKSVASLPIYTPMMPVQNILNLPFDYTSNYPQPSPVVQMPVPRVWRNI